MNCPVRVLKERHTCMGRFAIEPYMYIKYMHSLHAFKVAFNASFRKLLQNFA